MPLCPSGQLYGYQAFYAPGKMEIFREVLESELSEPTEGLFKAVYACTLCGACYEKCKQITSVEIELPELFEELREELVEKGWFLESHREIAEKIKETKNAYGEEKNKYEIESLYYKADTDILYYIGCTPRYRVPEIADSMLEIFDKLGTNYQVMEDEWCCGSVLLRTGHVEDVKELMAHNVEAIKRSGAKTVVFTCPGCLMTFKKSYPDMGLELVHSTQFLATRLEDMDMKKQDIEVVYHDPCHLGRGLGIYEEPRAVLKSFADLKEMKRAREQAWCCGSGGGVKSAFDDLALWSAAERLKDAKESGAGADAVVSACPFCKRNMKEAAENEGIEIEVYDVVELVKMNLEGRKG